MDEVSEAVWQALEESGAITTRYLISEMLEEAERSGAERRSRPEDAFGALTYAVRVIEGG